MEQQNHSRKGGSVQITSGLYVKPMAEHGPRPAGSKAMMDKESPAGSWKQAIEWMRQVKNDAPVADRPNADDYRNRAERAEAECQELQEQVDILMEKCRQWKQSTEMVCAIRSDNITLGDLYRAGVTVSFSVE